MNPHTHLAPTLILSTLLLLTTTTALAEGPPAQPTMSPELAIQLGNGLDPTHAFRANVTTSFGDRNASAIRDLTPNNAAMPPLILTARAGEAAAFALSVTDVQSGAEVLNYTGTLSIATEGNVSLLKDRTWIEPTYWTPKAGTAIAINYGSASAYLVAQAIFADNVSRSATISWGLDENGDGTIDQTELDNSTATGANWTTQKYYPILPVKTALVLSISEAGTSLGSVRGTYYLGGITTFESQTSELSAPLKTARVAVFRIPRNTVTEVNGTEFAATTTSRQQPGPPGGLPITAGSVAGLSDLAPTCPAGQTFDTSLGCIELPSAATPTLKARSEASETTAAPREARMAAVNETAAESTNSSTIGSSAPNQGAPEPKSQSTAVDEPAKVFPWTGVWYLVLVVGLMALVVGGVRKMRKA